MKINPKFYPGIKKFLLLLECLSVAGYFICIEWNKLGWNENSVEIVKYFIGMFVNIKIIAIISFRKNFLSLVDFSADEGWLQIK